MLLRSPGLVRPGVDAASWRGVEADAPGDVLTVVRPMKPAPIRTPLNPQIARLVRARAYCRSWHAWDNSLSLTASPQRGRVPPHPTKREQGTAMRTFISRRQELPACVAMVVLGVLVASGTAQARHAPRWEVGNVECSVIEFTGYGIGLPTYLPRVYAWNMTRRRDLQRVATRSDLYQLVGGQFVLQAQGEVHRGLAADNNYVVSWRNDRTGAQRTIHDRLQWILYTNGFYRVQQHVWWYPTRSLRGYHVHRRLFHTPSADSSWCFIP